MGRGHVNRKGEESHSFWVLTKTSHKGCTYISDCYVVNSLNHPTHYPGGDGKQLSHILTLTSHPPQNEVYFGVWIEASLAFEGKEGWMSVDVGVVATQLL